MKVGLIWITVIYLTWNFNVLQELENSDHTEAMDTSTGIMNTEERPLHTPVPFGDEVGKISYYCHYHYYAQINSKLQHRTVQPTRHAHFTVVLAYGGGGERISTFLWWDGAFESDVSILSSIKNVFYRRSFKGEESTFWSNWPRKTIFTSWNDAYNPNFGAEGGAGGGLIQPIF